VHDVLRHLVVSRICQQQSKVATVDYLKSYFDEDVDLNKIYRYLDKLSDTQKDKIQEISVNHTRKVLGGNIGVVFYDVTTLYFETDFADNLRKTGFSKDGKHSQPQVVLGLLVSDGGYPLAYSIHEGNKYEGHTMLPIDKVLSIAKTITTIKVKLQESKETITKTMLLTDKHKSIARLFEAEFWENFR